MYFGVGGQCNITFPILKSINSALISPTAGDTNIISKHFYSGILSVLTLFVKGD